jgi:hypothetical protein
MVRAERDSAGIVEPGIVQVQSAANLSAVQQDLALSR